MRYPNYGERSIHQIMYDQQVAAMREAERQYRSSLVERFHIPGSRDLFEEKTTTYNEMKFSQEELKNMHALYEVFVIDRTRAEAEPLTSVQKLSIVAATAEGARTIALLSLQIAVPDLNKFHVHAVEVCKVPFLASLPGPKPEPNVGLQSLRPGE